MAMNQATMNDIIRHINTCERCEHLKGSTHRFSKALLQKAIVEAHQSAAK
jgi:hypothetical protein